ncbi:DNA endonuclease RBBP8 [Limanda limanda]|uniref:DNA endonuclease RBBP8 n=1 Tax=Limanda limanda TaxID=27771 RepID=UPI0029C6302C|nr:DNA endonuclease RBBP8 [Limanda limanda]
MSSPGPSSGTNRAAELFEDLWRQLGECHQNSLQELGEKVVKLKKERHLDAQRLEVFHSRNQQLKEQNTSLKDAISLLEERLRAGECDRCAVLEENLKNDQEQNLRLIAELKNERNGLKDENRKLQAEVQNLKMSCSELQRASSPEQEEGIIPDSPVMASSLPVANRLKKRKNMDKSRRLQYTERPLMQINNSLFSELNKKPVDAAKNPGRAEVLVPNTCVLDLSQISNDVNPDRDDVVAETCSFDLLVKHHMKSEVPPAQQRSLKPPWKNNVSLKPCGSSSTLIHSPDSTSESSLSLLPRVKRFSVDSSIQNAKRKKEEIQRKEDIKHGTQERVDAQKEGKHIEPEVIKRTSTPNQSLMKQPPDSKDKERQVNSGQKEPNVFPASPAFKKPDERCKGSGDGVGRRRHASHVQHEAENAEKKYKVEPMWSIDPALALSMYDSEQRGGDEQTEEQCHGELEDTDCTWVSHSLLQGRGENDQDREDSATGLGGKANDSLDMMFDTSANGEYKSFTCSHVGQSQHCGDGDDDDDDDEEEEEEEEEKDNERDAPENSPSQSKSRQPTFAHVVVVRKKDERRKLKGTTCKECDIYYAHLSEEEKQKKLSACSRHRFLYIPPSTPENFWEVGFPSTQTCIDRGYINEEKKPQVRSRRRTPLNAFFSQKQKS